MYLYNDDDGEYFYCVCMSPLSRLLQYLSSFKRTASTTIEYSRSVPSIYNPIPQLMSGDALDPIQYLSHYKSHTRFLAGPFEEVLGIENKTRL